jgi:hypothetical protein
MSTTWTSFLPFLAALQRNQNMPDDDDDSTPPVDQFGRVLASQGMPQAPGASQSNLASTAQQVQPQDSKGQLLIQLLQSGLQSSNSNQAQATNDDDDSKPPVDPTGLVGVVPGASQSNMQSDAIGNIVRSMTPGALPVYPPLQQAAAMSSKPNPQFERPDTVKADEQVARQRGQATQPPMSDAQRKAGFVIRVGIRRLLGSAPGDFGHHTYLEIPRLDQDGHPVYDTDGNVVYDSYGVLGQWDYKKGNGTTKNQQVMKDDVHFGKNGLQLRNEPKPGSDNNALYEIAVSPDQLAQLKAGAEHWSQWETTGDKCPSCGKDYKTGIPLKDPYGYNSNTWVYNMLVQNPAGRIEPPAEITQKALKSRDEGLALDILAPGWNVNDSSKEYYPGPRPVLPGKQK